LRTQFRVLFTSSLELRRGSLLGLSDFRDLYENLEK
jgi:hypothetical protein